MSLKLNKPSYYENIHKVYNDSTLNNFENRNISPNQNKFKELTKEEYFLNDSFHSKGSIQKIQEETEFHACNIPKNVIMDTLRRGDYKTEETKTNNNYFVSGKASHHDQYVNTIKENDHRRNYLLKESSVIYELDNLSINEENSYEIYTKTDHVITIDLAEEEEKRYDYYPHANKKLSEYIMNDNEEGKRYTNRSRSRSPRETSLFSYTSSQELFKRFKFI